MKKKSLTAAELMAKLQNDEIYQEKLQKKEKEKESFEELLKANEKNLVELINKKGIKISSVWDLVNTNKSYSIIIPILIENLKKSYHPKIKAGIARALAVPEAKGIAWDTLIDEYLKTEADEDITEINKRGYKEGLSVALSYLMDDTKIQAVLDLILDKKHKASRIFLLDALAKYKTNSKVVEAVKVLKNDSDLKKVIKKKF